MALKPIGTGLSPASADLGLGSALSQQVKDETDEQRKKRMLQIQQNGGIGGSLAVTSLLGASGGL